MNIYFYLKQIVHIDIYVLLQCTQASCLVFFQRLNDVFFLVEAKMLLNIVIIGLLGKIIFLLIIQNMYNRSLSFKVLF